MAASYGFRSLEDLIVPGEALRPSPSRLVGVSMPMMLASVGAMSAVWTRSLICCDPKPGAMTMNGTQVSYLYGVPCDEPRPMESR